MARIRVAECEIKHIELDDKKIEDILYMLITFKMIEENKSNTKDKEERYDMKLKDLINRLEEFNYAIGGFINCDYYIKNKNEDVKVGIYVRRSKGDKNAVDNQLASVRYVVEGDFGIDSNDISTYIDNGVSGTSDIRPAYLNLKMDLQHGKINAIIVANIDRLGRTTEVLLEDIFPEVKVKHLFVALDNKMINGLGNRSLILKKAEQADSYAAECSEKSRRGLKAKMKSGSCISSKPPYGYEIMEIGSIRKLVLGDPIHIEVVKTIFNMYIQGNSLGKIADYLSNQNIKSPSGKSIWGKTTIKSILTNTHYTGELSQGKSEKQGYSNNGDSKKIKKVSEDKRINGGTFDGIIDKETFDTVQERLEENKCARNKTGENKLFATLIKCGKCERALTYRKKSHSYQCIGTVSKPYNCTSHLISEDELKKVINSKIRLILKEMVSNNTIVDVENKIDKGTNNESLNRELVNIDEEIKSYIRQMVDIQNKKERYSELIIEELEERISQRELKRKDILERIDASIEYNKKMKDVLKDINNYDIESNEVYRLFIKQIRVYESKKIEIDWRC